jgi:ankyrin repeat protein
MKRKAEELDLPEAKQPRLDPIDLFEAAKIGDVEAMQRLIDKNGADVNVRANNGATLLHVAACYGKVEAVAYLIDQKGADVNVRANNGATLLHVAACYGKVEAVAYLIDQKGADVNVQDNKGVTPLHFAASYGKVEAMAYLIDQKGADVNVQDNKGGTPLHFAASYGKVEAMAYLIDQKGADVNVQDNKGGTPLHFAAVSGRVKAMEYLIDQKKVDVNVRDNNGTTPLHMAASRDKVEVTAYLIEKGADVNSVNIRNLNNHNIKNMLFAAGYESTVPGFVKIRHVLSLPQTYTKAVKEDKEYQKQLSEMNIKDMPLEAIGAILYERCLKLFNDTVEKELGVTPIPTPEQNEGLESGAMALAKKIAGQSFVSRFAPRGNVPTLQSLAARCINNTANHNISVEKEAREGAGKGV